MIKKQPMVMPEILYNKINCKMVYDLLAEEFLDDLADYLEDIFEDIIFD